MNKLPFTAFALMAVIFLASCGGGDDKGGDDKGGDDKGKKENNDKGGDDKASKKENKNQGEANYSEDTGIDPEQMSMTGVDGTEVAMGDVEVAMGDVEDAMGDVEDAMGDVEDAMDDVVVADRSNNSECDEYLAGYEKFMDNYITILKKQQADPSDMSIMEEYMSIMTESSEWATNEPDCTDMEFLEKLMVIQLKMADAVSGMY